MTREGYDTDHLVKLLSDFRKRHNVHVILEPGSAFAWQTGDLHTTVLDVVGKWRQKDSHFRWFLYLPYARLSGNAIPT